MPTQAQIHAITDALAARIQANLNGYAAEVGAGTQSSLAAQLDAIGDLDLEGALMASFLQCDRQSLPEQYKTALPHLLGRAGYADLVSAWQNYVAAEGAYASLDALLTDLGATLHPLAAEAFRHVQGDGAVSAANVFAPSYGVIAPVRLYQGADGSLSEETVDAGDVGTADVTLFASDNHALYVGADSKFSALVIGLSTAANVTITPTFQYWNGSAWVTLSVTDNTAGLTLNDVITWTPPANWQRCAADAGGTAFSDTTPRYYLRIARTADTVGTPPVGTMIRLQPAAVLNASGAHLGVPQPALALVRITGAATLAVVAGVDPSTRFKAPAFRLRALTPGLGTPTLTVSYTDQDGNAATQAQSALESPAAGDTIAVTLAGGDTGVLGILTTGWVVSGGARGILALEVAETRTPAL
jgi:hypothetical protein